MAKTQLHGRLAETRLVPSFELVKGLVHSYIEKGIEPTEADALHQFVLDGRATPTDRHITQLVRLSETFADHFTPSGAAVWQRLTGIAVRDGKVVVPHELKARVLSQAELRTMVARDREWLANAYPVTTTKKGPVVETRALSFSEVSARTATDVEPATLNFEQALELNLPGKLLRATLQRRDSRVVDRVLYQIGDLERRYGDNNGKVVPRDLARASPMLKQVLDVVYERLGRRELSLDEIRTVLPDAIEKVVWGGTSKANRKKPELRDLYTEVCEDCVTHFAEQYRRTVTEGAGFHLQFVERMGFASEVDKARITALAQAIMPPPTLDELQALYEKATSGKLGAKDFYNAARIDAADLWLLQARLPDAFARVEGQKETQALAAPKTIRTTEVSPDDLSEAWIDEVVNGSKTQEAFCQDHDVRLVVFTRLKKAHPKLFPPKAAGPANVDIAPALATALEQLMAAHPFDKVPKLLERLNGDERFTSAHGRISYGKYYAVRKENQGLFGRIDGAERWQKPVAERVIALVEQHPDWSRKDLVAALQESWPEMTYSRLAHLKEAMPNLPLPGSYNRRDATEIDRIAQAIADELDRDPDQSQEQIALRLTRTKKFGAIDRAYVAAVVRDFRPHLFVKVDGVATGRRTKQRHNVVARLLVHTAIRSLPPGTKSDVVFARYNALLKARGLTPIEKNNWAATLKHACDGTAMAGLDEYHAQAAAEILAEYTRAAKRGDDQATIVARVQRDYPTLTNHALGRYRALWQRTPPIPRVGAPRWLGGFDLRRVVAASTGVEQEEWTRMSEALHVPLRLPELDAIVDGLAGSKPLQGVNLVWVTHVLSDIPAMALTLREAGAAPSRMHIVGTPYGTSALVADTLVSFGMEITRPTLSLAAYEQAVEAALDRAVAAHRKNGQPIGVIDDGGLVSKLLNTKAKYKDIVANVRGVEQTTGGLKITDKYQLQNLVVAVARSESKRHEGAAIGEVVAQKMMQALRREADGLKGKKVTLMGYGIIGPAIAAELRKAGAQVTVVEPGDDNAKLAKALYTTITGNPNSAAYKAARAAALRESDLVLGATGGESISLADLRLLKKGCKVGSASSKRIEIDMDGLAKHAKKRTVRDAKNPITTLPTARYEGGGIDVTVIGDGWPLNFDGSVQSVPPEKIQLTDAALVMGLFQALRSVGQKGVVDFDKTTDRALLARHRTLEKKFRAAVYDPDGWIDALVAAGGAA